MVFNTFAGHTKRIIHYIAERILLRNLILAVLIFFGGLFVVFQVLKIYTRHNLNITVPDFSGMTLEEATSIAASRDLQVEVFDSVYLTDFERGTVVDQHPVSYFKVKKNRKIYLTMNAINPERVAMPDLVDLTIRQARSKLESFGLKTGEISYIPNIGVNVVLAQKMNGRDVITGDSIIKGSAIDLVAGKGLSEELTAVPDLLGLTLDSAKIIASDEFLGIGAVVADQSIVTDGDQNKARVFRQRPSSERGSRLPLGSDIDIWLTLDTLKLRESMQLNDSLNNR